MPSFTDRIIIEDSVYPIEIRGRYGTLVPPVPSIVARLEKQSEITNAFLNLLVEPAKGLVGVTDRAADIREPYFKNGFFGMLDAIVLYSALAHFRPQRYIEIGSGNTTKFAAKAKRDFGLETRIVTIDPAPRAKIAELADEAHHTRLENMPPGFFSDLSESDIILFDGSHRVFSNSDVTVFFLEVLPELASGVMVCIDDIYLPYDYPPDWNNRMYSEQYMLGVLINEGHQNYDFLFPARYAARSPLYSSSIDAIWAQFDPSIVHRDGKSFWLRER